MKKTLFTLGILAALTLGAHAVTDADNGDWSAKSVTLSGTSEAVLSVRVGDIDALNDEYAIENEYDPFTAASQYAHGYPWLKDEADPNGTDRIYVGSVCDGDSYDGYSSCYCDYINGSDTENAYGDGALVIEMQYDTTGIDVGSALLQLCIDDFQPISFGSDFTVKLNGKDAPFIAELLNHIDQTGPTSYIVSAILPQSFLRDAASGTLTITIDETTGCGDGFAVDFAKLLINYNDTVFGAKFSGSVDPFDATVRLLGTATTVTGGNNGCFEFEAVPGLNVVRASKPGYEEAYEYGIVLAENTEWMPEITLSEGESTPDIDFAQFGVTDAWAKASDWAAAELAEAEALGLIPKCLYGTDLTASITRAEFAAVSVKVYESLSGEKAQPVAVNPFTDCADPEVLKAYAIGSVTGTSATTFEPEALLNREQAATMLTRVFKKLTLEGWTVASDGAYAEAFRALFEMPSAFADDADISDWAKDSVYFMNANGIINGVGGNLFAPRNITEAQSAIGYANATREQALLIAARMVGKLK